MKKKLLKSIALVMCVVIACLSMPLGSSAAGKVYTVDELARYVEKVITNKSDTIALFEISKDHWYSGGYEYEEHQYAITRNGKDFEVLNFDKYKPAGSDCIMPYDCTVNGDLFAIVLKSYKKMVDEYSWVNFEETATIIITTKDFKTYTDCNFDVVQEKRALKYSEYYHQLPQKEECGLFEFIGDTLVFADMSYEFSGDKFSGIYYTSKDMKTWKKNKTALFDVKYDDLDEKFADILSYNAIDDVLIVERIEFRDFGRVCLESYATPDFKKYVKVYEKEEEILWTNIMYEKSKNSDNLIYLLSYDDFSGKFSGNELRSLSLSTEQKSLLTEINDERMHNGLLLSADEENVYLINSDNKGNTEKITVKADFTLTKSTPDYNIQEIQMVDILGETAVAYNNEILYLFTDYSFTDYEKYNIADIGFVSSWTNVFKLNGSLYMVESVYDDNFPDKPIYYPIRIAVVAEKSINKQGDLNGDSQVNSTDALVILQSAVGKTTLSASQKAVADVNKDGNVNSTDALKILQFVVEKISTL